MPSIRTLLSLLALFSIIGQSLAVSDQPPPDLNQAQILVFLGEHLRNTHQGQTLVYRFTRIASGEPQIRDKVKMTVTGVVDDVRRDLSFEFLSGDRRLNFPNAHSYRGNPIAVQFLERDIRDMSRNTGTPIGYLRNRIRNSFITPQIAQVSVDVGDVRVTATEITVVPFLKDANLAEFDGYAGKEYNFVYSDQIPGDLVRVRTRMSAADGTVLKEEILQYGGSTEVQ